MSSGRACWLCRHEVLRSACAECQCMAHYPRYGPTKQVREAALEALGDLIRVAARSDNVEPLVAPIETYIKELDPDWPGV